MIYLLAFLLNNYSMSLSDPTLCMHIFNAFELVEFFLKSLLFTELFIDLFLGYDRKGKGKES